MNAIQSLEQCLRRECPAVEWHCDPFLARPQPAKPPKIQIHARSGGAEIAGSPLSLSPDFLHELGADSTARLIRCEVEHLLDPAHDSHPESDLMSDF